MCGEIWVKFWYGCPTFLSIGLLQAAAAPTGWKALRTFGYGKGIASTCLVISSLDWHDAFPSEPTDKPESGLLLVDP